VAGGRWAAEYVFPVNERAWTPMRRRIFPLQVNLLYMLSFFLSFGPPFTAAETIVFKWSISYWA